MVVLMPLSGYITDAIRVEGNPDLSIAAVFAIFGVADG